MRVYNRRLALVLSLTVTACAEVPPWQRGYLALPQMSFTPNTLLHGLRQHTAFSKEATAGGYGGSGGGCGCN